MARSAWLAGTSSVHPISSGPPRLSPSSVPPLKEPKMSSSWGTLVSLFRQKKKKRISVDSCSTGADSGINMSSDRQAITPDPPLIDRGTSYSEYCALLILFFVNLINYMDRVTIAAVLEDVQKYYDLDNKMSGILQTAFVVSYMIFAPVFGYLGDRYSRKILMTVGVFFWSLTTLLGSIPPEHFGVFLLLRALVGVGEASYSTIAPTIIGDIFPEKKRHIALGVFYYAIPIGSGLGYMVGSNVATALGHWSWALRVTPVLGVVAIVLILVFLRDPPRGEADGGVQLSHTSMLDDVRDLGSNLSYIWATLGFTAATFALGAMSWWAPVFMTRAMIVYNNGDSSKVSKDRINLIFGTITCVGGAVGITTAVLVSGRLRKFSQRADPAICAVGLILGIPLILTAVLLADKQPIATWVFFFFGLTFLSLNWSIVPDMLLYTVIPTRRGSGSAFQILVSHALGDAASPYIVGAISDSLKTSEDYKVLFTSLRDAMLLPVAILVLGAAAFIINIFTIIRDKDRCQMQMQATRLDVTVQPLPDVVRNGGQASDESLWSSGRDVDTNILITPSQQAPVV